MRTVQSPVSRLAARLAGGPVRQRGARPCDGQRHRQRGDLEHLTQYVRTDVAQLAAPVSAEHTKVPEPVDQTGHERVTGTPFSPT